MIPVVREVSALGGVASARLDLIQAGRSLVRRPRFAVAMVSVMGLGIGTTTGMFAVVDGVALRPLGFTDGERVVSLWQTNLDWRTSASPTLQRQWRRFPLSYPVFEHWQLRQTAFSALGAFSEIRASISGNEPELLHGVAATSGVFAALGVAPTLGRTLTPGDDVMGSPAVVVLGYDTWTGHFGADSTVVGRTMEVNGVASSVVGIMPPTFHFPNRDVGFWINFDDAARSADWRSQFMQGLGRLRPGIPIERAQEDMEAIAAGLRAVYPPEVLEESSEGFGVHITHWHDEIAGPVRSRLLLLLAAVGLVLLVCCLNAASLSLVRALDRDLEYDVRIALGAGKSHLLRQSVLETMLVALAGGATASVLLWLGLDTLRDMLPPQLTRVGEISFDHRVLAFACGATVLTGMAAGLSPAVRSSRRRLGRGRAGTFGRSRAVRRGLGVLVSVEAGLSVVLVVGGGVLGQSLRHLVTQETGFEIEGLSTLRMEPSVNRFDDDTSIVAFYEQLRASIGALAGVSAVGGGSVVPFDGRRASHGIAVPTPAGDTTLVNARRTFVFGDYFEAMGIPVIRGRTFRRPELDGARSVVVSRRFAETYFPGVDPIGMTLLRGGTLTIVGVVGDVPHDALQSDPGERVYYPLELDPQRGRSQTLVARTTLDERSLLSAMRQAAWAVDAGIPVAEASTMSDLLSDRLAKPRFETLLVSALGVLAWLLSAIGIYAVIAFGVTTSGFEVGVRMSLGATRMNILTSVVARGVLLAGAGTVAGGVVALAGLRLLDTFVYVEGGAAALGAPALTLAVTTSLLTAALASSVPARRASLREPSESLRGGWSRAE